MENAIAQTGTPVAPPTLLSAMPTNARLMLALGVAGLVAVVVALALLLPPLLTFMRRRREQSVSSSV